MSELKEYRVSIPLHELECDGLVFTVKAASIDDAIKLAYSGEYENIEAVYSKKSYEG